MPSFTRDQRRWIANPLARQLLAALGIQRAAQEMAKRTSGREREWWSYVSTNVTSRLAWEGVGRTGAAASSLPPPPPPPPPPVSVANNDAFFVNESGSSIELDVLSNDTNLTARQIFIQTQPARGSVAVVDSGSPTAKIAWTDNSSGAGSTSFTYRVDTSNVATVSLTIQAFQVLTGLFVSTTGSDAATGTAANPLLTIAEAASRLAGVGGNVYVRGGRYGAATISSSGIVGSPIVIQSYPGEVARFDTNWSEFQTVGNTAWEPDPDSAAEVEVYRSVATSYGTGTNSRGTFWVNDTAIGKTVLSGMRPYGSLTELRSTNYRWQSDYVYYGGPGFVFSGGRIYIRIQNLASPRNAGVPQETVVNPLGNLANHPPSSLGFDPRDYEINLTNTFTTLTVDGSHVQFKKLDVRGHRGVLFGSGRTNILVENCRIYAMRAVEDGGSNSNCTVRRSVIDTGMSPCFSWNEVHGTGSANHPRMEGKAWAVSNPVNALMEQCHIVTYFDGSTGLGATTNGLVYRQCHISFSWDDMWQFNGGAEGMECDRVFARGSGPGYNGGGVDSSDQNYIHHSIFDCRDGSFGWRLGMENNNGGGPAWRPGNMPLASHSADANQPFKIYHVLVLHGWNNGNDGCRLERQGIATTGLHEVRNCIAWAVHTGDQPNSYIRGPGTDTARAFYDYNIIRPPPTGGYSAAMFNDYPGGDYTSLAAWKASASFNGWEANSKQGDPQLADPDNLDFRPSPTGIAATGAQDLTSKGWPRAGNVPYFGPVDPNSSTGLGDVGIPVGTPVGPEESAWSLSGNP